MVCSDKVISLNKEYKASESAPDLIGKPDKSPVRFLDGFHFDDYGVYQGLGLQRW